jgi:hypothetical protein
MSRYTIVNRRRLFTLSRLYPSSAISLIHYTGCIKKVHSSKKSNKSKIPQQLWQYYVSIGSGVFWYLYHQSILKRISSSAGLFLKMACAQKWYG